MDALTAIADAHGVVIIEDAAEAHGAEYKGRRVGGLAKCGVFSFYGNKVITTGEGGMLTTNDREFHARAKAAARPCHEPAAAVFPRGAADLIIASPICKPPSVSRSLSASMISSNAVPRS